MMAFLSGTALVVNLRRLQANTKVQAGVIDKLLYADDMVDNARKETTLQGSIDRVLQACDNYDLTNSTKKTEVIYQPAP